jgi:hypothetical protein
MAGIIDNRAESVIAPLPFAVPHALDVFDLVIEHPSRGYAGHIDARLSTKRENRTSLVVSHPSAFWSVGSVEVERVSNTVNLTLLNDHRRRTAGEQTTQQ